MLGTYDRLGLLEIAQGSYTLGDPIHGVEHWLAVEEAAVEMAYELGADVEIASMFGLLHDCLRQNSWHDPEHGLRAARLAAEINADVLGLPRVRLQKLTYAVQHHDAGMVSDDIDVSTCWAADRRQLRRVGVEPSRQFFCDRTWPIVQRMLAREVQAAA